MDRARQLADRLGGIGGLLWLVALLSVLLYAVAVVLPYNLFAHVGSAPVSFPEIARREPFPAAAFLLTFLTLFGFYALAYRACLRHGHERLLVPILLSGLAFALVLSLTYPVGAGDVVDYVSHGEELAYHGANPLVVPPAAIDGSVFAPFSAFRQVPSNYGPVWTWISALVVGTIGRESLAYNLLGFKAVAIASYLIQALLIYAILRRRNPARATAGVLFFAWNPLVLYEFAANGHNDAAMMAFALLGILSWELDRPLLMVVTLTLSFLTKIPMAPLLPLFLLGAARRRSGRRRFWATLSLGGLLSVALVGLAYLSLPEPLLALRNLSNRSDLFTHSLPMILNLTLRLGGLEKVAAESVARAAAILALGLWYVVCLWRTWRTPAGALRRAYDFVLFLLLFATPWFQPWYVTWLVALAALLPHPAAPTQAGLFSLSVMASYVVYGFVWFWIPSIANWGHCLGINLMAVSTTYMIPWAYTARLWLQARRSASPQ
jgi:alpha-1,6-mannosyltransferase